MTKYTPGGYIRAVRVQNLDFVAVVEGHGLQVNMSNRFNYTVHKKYIPLDDFKALKTSGPDRRVPDPNVFRSFDKPVGHSPVVEVGRWARPGVEGTTSGLDIGCMERNLRAVVPLWKVEEPITEEGQRREGTKGKKLSE